MVMYEATDKFILSIFQKISDKVQEYVGLTCFKIAHSFFAVAMMGSLIDIIGTFMSGATFWGIVGVVFIPIIYIVMIYLLISAEKQCLKDKTIRNPCEVSFFGVRRYGTFLLVLSLLSLGAKYPNLKKVSPEYVTGYMVQYFGHRLWVVALWLGLYFGSCTPKPYQDSKVKKMVKSLLGVLKLRLAFSK